VIFEFYGRKIGAAGAGVCTGSRLASSPLIPPLEVRVEIFEAQGQQHAGREGDGYGSRSIGFWMIAHRHLVIVIVPYSIVRLPMGLGCGGRRRVGGGEQVEKWTRIISKWRWRSFGEIQIFCGRAHATSLQHRSMDSPLLTRLFRQLFSHRACQSVRSRSELPFRIQGARRHAQRRCISSTSRKREGAGDASRNESHWQQRSDLFPLDMSEEYQKYPMVTADQLRGRRERPRRVKMLTRDFIEGFQSYPSITEQKLRMEHRLLIQPFIWLLL